MDDGYDQAYEDRLFETIKWPTNGYRLFEIGHFVGDRDWIDGVWESNCMFVPRAQLEQVGGFEERFAMAGGGYANLELYERLGSAPDVTVCTILGEGSFHQTHGGTTTNQTDAAERRARVFGYGKHYRELRGRPFKGPGKPIHFVGRLTTGAARRTKPRRLSTPVFAEAAEAVDGRPERPTPVPDDLREAFTDAVWRNLPWRFTTWLGAPDLHAADRPARLPGDPQPGAARLGDRHRRQRPGPGHVPGVDLRADRARPGASRSATPTADAPPPHFRLRCCTGDPLDPAVVDHVHGLVGDGNAVVVLGALRRPGGDDRAVRGVRQARQGRLLRDRHRHHRQRATRLDRRSGPGPAEGIKQILNRHGKFVADPEMEKYALTFNPGGFLRREP